MTTYPRLPSLGDGYPGTATQLPHPQAHPKNDATPHPNDGGSQVGTMCILGTVGLVRLTDPVNFPTAPAIEGGSNQEPPFRTAVPGGYVRRNLGVSRLSRS